MKKVLTGLVTGAVATALVLGSAGAATALAVSDYTSCPGGRQLIANGNAKGYIYVSSNGKVSQRQGSSSTRYYASVRSGAQSASWYVSSGSGDSELPNHSIDCSIN